jgi:hypothetical protein
MTVSNTPTECRSQLAKNLGQALMLCQLRDDLSELVNHPESIKTEEQVKELLLDAYRKATVLLACAVIDTENDMMGTPTKVRA